MSPSLSTWIDVSCFLFASCWTPCSCDNFKFLKSQRLLHLLLLMQDNFKAWNDALQTRDYTKVVPFYSEKELSFLPTVSPNLITKQTGSDPKEETAKDYFIEFLKKMPNGVVTEEAIQVFCSLFSIACVKSIHFIHIMHADNPIVYKAQTRAYTSYTHELARTC